jgi:hypothetical protein
VWGIVQRDHLGPATSLYASFDDAVEAMRNSIPGACLVETDARGNPLTRREGE